MIKLTKPLIFFDLETTGADVTTARIVQIAAIKLLPDGSKVKRKTLINPGVKIPAEATEIHGITDEMVANAPTFASIAPKLFSFFSEGDLAGYNSNEYDIPVLQEEFVRCGLDFPAHGVSFLDVLKVERIINDQKLVSVYKRYTGKDLEGAHDAMADIEATLEVFTCQVMARPEIGESVSEIDSFCQGEKKRVDVAGKIYQKDGEFYWSFGKLKDRPVTSDFGYIQWFMKQDFPRDSKKAIERIWQAK